MGFLSLLTFFEFYGILYFLGNRALNAAKVTQRRGHLRMTFIGGGGAREKYVTRRKDSNVISPLATMTPA
jgi:hypothetical protein